MINAQLELITYDDLEALVIGKASENRTLEFKSCLPSGSDEHVKEFLADVTSLANSSGGDLVFGIEENRGFAENICGIPAANIEKKLFVLKTFCVIAPNRV